MPTVNFQNFPPQEGFEIDLSEIPNFDLHPNDAYDRQEGDRSEPRVSSRVFEGNEVKAAYLEFEPGQLIPWHTHDPDQYQLVFIYQGTLRVSYKDPDGEIHSTEIGPHQVAYLPPGAANQLEAVDGDLVRAMAIERKTAVSRVEQMFEETSEGVYNEKEVYVALDLDTLRGKVHRIDENVVTRY